MYAAPSITQHGSVVRNTLSGKPSTGEPSAFVGNTIGAVGFNL